VCFRVSLDYFDFALSKLVFLGVVFFITEPSDWRGITSPKLPILYRVGRKTLLISQYSVEEKHRILHG